MREEEGELEVEIVEVGDEIWMNWHNVSRFRNYYLQIFV